MNLSPWRAQLGKYYNDAAIPDSMRRNYDVYERIENLGIDLGTFLSTPVERWLGI